MFLNLLILSVILVAIAFIGLGFNIFFKKNGKFPETGVGHNPEMRKRGLTCAKTEELRQFQLQKGIVNAKNGVSDPTSFTGGCAGCSCD
jgi:hypothetical protein